MAEDVSPSGTSGLRTKFDTARSGRQMGGLSFTRGYLYKLLGNALYVGDISHKGERHRGQHDAIVDKDIWDQVQAMLGDNTQGKRQRANATEPSLLAGLLVDEFGNKLTATHAVKNGKARENPAGIRFTCLMVCPARSVCGAAVLQTGMPVFRQTSPDKVAVGTGQDGCR
ncbi:MAG: recombinase family protein [Devosia sp.]